MSDPRVTVVGIGADGWDGLAAASRAVLRGASVVLGGARQLGLLPSDLVASRVPWPSPMLPALGGLLASHPGAVVLASGDPMFYGVGSAIVSLLGAGRVRVLPHPSSVSLACARLGWPLEDTEVISAVGRPLAALAAVLAPGRRILVLSAGSSTPSEIVDLLAERGYGDSEVLVLEGLGGPAERIGPVRSEVLALNIVAVRCAEGAAVLSAVPGLPDEVFEHDGQLTKREVRAVTLALLAPVPGQLLWDVGAGAGSVAIEWMRAHRSCRAIAVEARPDRSSRIALNASSLGVPSLCVITGSAPLVLSGLAAPDAVFVGGGATVPGVLRTCWEALPPGGRLVVNAVTVESLRVVLDWHADVGGSLTQIAISRSSPLGGFMGWRAVMPVTQWAVTR